MLNADRLPHSTICQNESPFNSPDWVAGEARAKIPAQRASRSNSQGHRPWKQSIDHWRRPNGPTIRLVSIEWPPRLVLCSTGDTLTWADGPGYWNWWAFGPRTKES